MYSKSSEHDKKARTEATTTFQAETWRNQSRRNQISRKIWAVSLGNIGNRQCYDKELRPRADVNFRWNCVSTSWWSRQKCYIQSLWDLWWWSTMTWPEKYIRVCNARTRSRINNWSISNAWEILCWTGETPTIQRRCQIRLTSEFAIPIRLQRLTSPPITNQWRAAIIWSYLATQTIMYLALLLRLMGHPGKIQMKDLMFHSYCWQHMANDIYRWVQRCLSCGRYLHRQVIKES